MVIFRFLPTNCKRLLVNYFVTVFSLSFMIKYNPAKPLISLHIPKCGGQSVRRILKTRFGENLYFHYYQDYSVLPPRYELNPGICIHGHFNNTRGFGVDDYYPGADQFITFLRDPLEIMLSNYFFWKRKARKKQIKTGFIKEGDEHDYRDIEDFFAKRPVSHIPNFLPKHLAESNYQEIFDEKFVYIGIVDDMRTSLKKLARKLGFKLAEEVWINKSERDEEVSQETGERFIAANAFAYEIYYYAKKNYTK